MCLTQKTPKICSTTTVYVGGQLLKTIHFETGVSLPELELRTLCLSLVATKFATKKQISSKYGDKITPKSMVMNPHKKKTEPPKQAYCFDD